MSKVIGSTAIFAHVYIHFSMLVIQDRSPVKLYWFLVTGLVTRIYKGS